MPTDIKRPFFSVVIPVYNKEAYLSATIHSVLNQQFTNFELLLVLDPSTDKSENIARSFNDPRIRILNRKVPGPGGYAARNFGIAQAVADWIAFQDADDLWFDNHLQCLYNTISTDPENVSLVCTAYTNDTNGRKTPNVYHRKFAERGSHYFGFADFLLYKPVHSINVAVRKKIFEQSGGFPEVGVTRGGDYETWLRVMNEIRRGYWIKDVTAVYNKNVSDGVIKTTKPLTYNHVVHTTVQGMISLEPDPDIVRALKRFSNSFIKTGVKFQGRSGVLTRRDVKALFEDVYENRSQLMFFKVLALLPGWAQRITANVYSKFKND